MSRFAHLPLRLDEQLKTIVPSHADGCELRPCAITLVGGSRRDCAYVVDVTLWRRLFGHPPADPSRCPLVPIEQVVRIAESPLRLPVALADRLYREGESGMGYTLFKVLFADGRSRPYIAGNFPDFIDPPDGLSAADAVDVEFHAGRFEQPKDAPRATWCLHEGVGERD